MKQINVLDAQTVNKIAAGEVVDRPASIVKELVENAIDAKASAIAVEIKDGGISFIRVTDNGEGIDKSQVPTAFLAHATSKIQTVEDLLSVTSLGFRGEALSSIAAVSKVELLTKSRDDFLGTRYVIEGALEKVYDDAGVPDGTTFIVRDLFFNTPARRKFLKSAQTEASYVMDHIEHAMLSNPDVSFKLTVNGKVKLQSSGNGNMLDVIYSIYGRDIANAVIPVSAEGYDMKLSGFVGKPELSRGNRNFMLYFINGRPVKSKIINNACEEAFKQYLMLHKYPLLFLYIDMPSHLLDVNVHPQKMEIRFLEEQTVYDFIKNAVSESLSSKELIVPNYAKSDDESKKPVIKKEDVIPEPFLINKSIEASEKNDIKPQTYIEISKAESIDVHRNNLPKLDFKSESSLKSEKANDEQLFVEEATVYVPSKNNVTERDTEKSEQLSLFTEQFLTETAYKQHKIIGQLFETYWLIEYDNKLYIIDQHAAHEKVMYERFVKKIAANDVTSQNIMPPIIVSLSRSEAEVLDKYLDNFKELGFEIECFGGNDYQITAVPSELFGQSPKEYFVELLDEMISGQDTKWTDTVNLKIATMACKAAVKGNMSLSLMEAKELIDELLKLENPYNCPHGRPTIVSYSKYEIEKMFKRIVV